MKCETRTGRRSRVKSRSFDRDFNLRWRSGYADVVLVFQGVFLPLALQGGNTNDT
ncbi:MAG: hypothetical protein J7641_12065 [Cyanobacteria bacterium SID2]|nr:hypothetical protein [Cyanobacteria bacterium SID2]MBP0003039.1 hypothetical protein [Cyanobacteria bacterium SBC]